MRNDHVFTQYDHPFRIALLDVQFSVDPSAILPQFTPIDLDKKQAADLNKSKSLHTKSLDTLCPVFLLHLTLCSLTMFRITVASTTGAAQWQLSLQIIVRRYRSVIVPFVTVDGICCAFSRI